MSHDAQGLYCSLSFSVGVLPGTCKASCQALTPNADPRRHLFGNGQLCLDVKIWLPQWFMEGGAMPKLLHLLHDEDATCRTKALLALSCLIRLNPLALEVFRQKRGIPQLVAAVNDEHVTVQR